MAFAFDGTATKARARIGATRIMQRQLCAFDGVDLHPTETGSPFATVIRAWPRLFGSTIDCRTATDATEDNEGEWGMSRCRYRVERLGACWKIRSEHQEHGPYATQSEAIAAAIDAAQRTGPTARHGAQVLVQQRGSTYRILWTFGEDPYPLSNEDVAFLLEQSPAARRRRRLGKPIPRREQKVLDGGLDEFMAASLAARVGEGAKAEG